jgi:sarcosine oxidase delta subunit
MAARVRIARPQNGWLRSAWRHPAGFAAWLKQKKNTVGFVIFYQCLGWGLRNRNK